MKTVFKWNGLNRISVKIKDETNISDAVRRQWDHIKVGTKRQMQKAANGHGKRSKGKG